MGYDHNFALNKTKTREMSWAVTVVEPESGRRMEIFTEESGIQFTEETVWKGQIQGSKEKLLITAKHLRWKHNISPIRQTSPISHQ